MGAVNVRGAYLASRRALPAMIAKRGGAIVNVASISGVAGPQKFPGFVSYCASKAAVISMTEALAVELGDVGVRVNCVSPGSVDTKMWNDASGGAPAEMMPEEIADAILFGDAGVQCQGNARAKGRRNGLDIIEYRDGIAWTALPSDCSPKRSNRGGW